MVNLRDPKRYYYAMRSKYDRELKQIGRKLDFALSKEEDSLLWEQFKKVLSRRKKLVIPEGLKFEKEEESWSIWFSQPDFSEMYIELTKEIRDIYAKKSAARTEEERREIDREVKKLLKQRDRVTIFRDRTTGQIVTRG